MAKKEVKFFPKSHKYKLGKLELTPVTKFVHYFFPEFNQKEIARKLAKIPKNKAEKKGVRYFLKEWDNDSKQGTIIHKALEDCVKQERISPENLKIIQGQLFLGTLPNSSKLLPEFKIVDTELRLAGTIDLLEIKDDAVNIYDYKTNKAIRDSAYKKSDKGIIPPCTDLPDCNLIHYSLQVSSYAYMLERSGYKIGTLNLVHLREDSWVLIKIDYNRFKKYIPEMVKVYNDKHKSSN